MFLSTILDSNLSAAGHFVTLTNIGLSCFPSPELKDLKELFRQTEIGLGALSSIGMVAGGLAQKPPKIVDGVAVPQDKIWLDVASFALGVLLVVDGAARLGLVTISKYSFSVKGRELTSDAFGTSITVMVVVVNLLDLYGAYSKSKKSDKPEDQRNFKMTSGKVGFKLLEIGAGIYFPSEKLISEAFKGLSATYGLIRAA